jgi:hypothetical protein
MLIDPDFLDHWRTRALVDALGGDEMAPLYLIRLWGHCQTRKSDTFEIPTAGLKALCRFPGQAADLEEALIQTGWAERDGRNLRACKWLEKNTGMVAKWQNGRLGGRPKKPTDNLDETEPEPTGTYREPIGQDRKGEEDFSPPTPQRGAAASRRGGGGKKRADAPGREELTAEGHRLGGAAAAFVDAFPTICTAAQWSAAGLAKLNGQAERLKITDGELTAAMDRLQAADRKYPTPKPSEVSEVLRDIFRRRGA